MEYFTRSWDAKNIVKGEIVALLELLSGSGSKKQSHINFEERHHSLKFFALVLVSKYFYFRLQHFVLMV